MSFEIGTKVKLKDEHFLSNAPSDMIIESIEGSQISVFWFGNDCSKKEAKFDVSFLEEIDSNEDYDLSDGAFYDDGLEDHGGSTVF